MKITAEDIKAGYRRMSDEELLSLNRGELTDLARQCYDEEVQARGLEEPENQSEDAVQDRPEAMPDEEMVVVAAPRYFDAAREMQATLESADIPAGIRRPESGKSAFQVVVPASLADDARRLLDVPEVEAIIVTARYENGVFKPIEVVDIAEGTIVEIHVPSAAIGAGES
jgi:hypothetical protein